MKVSDNRINETLKAERARLKDEKAKLLYKMDRAVEKVVSMYSTRDNQIREKIQDWQTRIDEAIKVVSEMKRARIESRKVYDVCIEDD